ncbi:Uncharacterised protein [Achromobacter sp. 2789STDY5608615]|nr:Uncharacterised protein [Achromobacter sp. 2789STDY5608615]
MLVTTPMGSWRLSSTGPCSMCSSTKAAVPSAPRKGWPSAVGSPPMRAMPCASVSPSALRAASMSALSWPLKARLPTQEMP